MFALIVALAMAAGDPGDNSARAHFVVCVREAMDKATSTKITPDGFAAFARQSCASELGAFRGDLISYDIKAGWTRKKAEPDADGQIGDTLADWVERYRDKGSITASK